MKLQVGDKFTLEYEVTRLGSCRYGQAEYITAKPVGSKREPYNLWLDDTEDLAKNIVKAPVELAVGQVWQGRDYPRTILAVTPEGVMYRNKYPGGATSVGAAPHESFHKLKGTLVED